MIPVYDALPLHDRRSIRLLEILSTGPQTSLSLQVYELDKRPHYCALSYTWRSPLGLRHANDDPPQVIKCNGQNFKVLPNLLAALHTIAKSAYSHKRFWIDAICINQDAEGEKAAQISIMPLIYRCADIVVAFLGPADEDSALALPLIRQLASLKQSDQQKILPKTHINIELGSWKALARFFCRSYFNRAWVVQEVIHASTVVAFCGEDKLDWDHIVRVSEMLSTSEWNYIFQQKAFRVSRHGKSHCGGPAKLRASKFQRAMESEDILLYNLIRCRGFQCSDPRDKVFSVISTSRQQFSINYDQSTAQIYTDTAKTILTSRDDLLLLSHAEGDDFRQIGSMPSWVPDWNVTATVGLGITGYRRYCAAPQERLEPALRGDILHVAAQPIGVIADVGESKRDVVLGKPCVGWLHIISKVSTSSTAFDAFWRTLLNDTGSDGKAPSSLAHAFVHWFARLLKPHMLNGQIRRLMATLEKVDGFEAFAQRFDIDEHEADRFGSSYGHTLCLRILRTDTNMLGAGTTSSRQGDEIFLVHGSRIPLILRKRSEAYELIGGCYLHGAMDGELIGEGVREVRIV